MPIMRRLGVPGIVFVPTSYIGGINGWDTGHEPEENICTWEDLHELEENGIAIESHSVSHPTFSDLTDDQHELQLRQSKAILEDHLGRLLHRRRDVRSRQSQAIRYRELRGSGGGAAVRRARIQRERLRRHRWPSLATCTRATMCI